jgi:hypothetical protein
VKTVREIFAEAVVMQGQGMEPRQVADRILELGREGGFVAIRERGSRRHGLPTIIELAFPIGGTIYFNGIGAT